MNRRKAYDIVLKDLYDDYWDEKKINFPEQVCIPFSKKFSKAEYYNHLMSQYNQEFGTSVELINMKDTYIRMKDK